MSDSQDIKSQVSTLVTAGKTLAIVAHSRAVQSLIEFYNLAAWFGDPLVVPAA